MKKTTLIILIVCNFFYQADAQYKKTYRSDTKSSLRKENRSLSLNGLTDTNNVIQTLDNLLFKLTKDTFATIQNSDIVPGAYFDTIIYSSINKYTLFNALAASSPNITLDVLEKQIAINYTRPTKINGLFWGLGLKADYNTDSKEATVYSNGSFVNNVMGTARLTQFLKGKALYNDSTKLRIELIQSLTELDKDIENKSKEIDMVRRAILIRNSSKYDSCCRFCSEQLIYGKDTTELEKELLAYKFKKLKSLMSFENINYNSETLRWLSLEGNFGIPAYKVYDATQDLGKKITDYRSLEYGIATSLNWLRHYKNDRVLFFSGGVKYERTANTDDLKAKDYNEQLFVASNTTGSITTEKKQKAYDASLISTIDRLKINGEIVWICFQNLKAGFDYYAEVATPWFLNNNSKPVYTSRLGYVFPVSVKKDKIVTMLQVYWKCSGQKDRKFDNDFGFKIGLPINLDKETK